MFRYKRALSVVLMIVFTICTMFNIIPKNTFAASKTAPKAQLKVSGLKGSYYVKEKGALKLTVVNIEKVQYSVTLLDSKKKPYKSLTNGYTKIVSGATAYTIVLPTDKPGTFYINVLAKKIGSKNYDLMWTDRYIVKLKDVVNGGKIIKVTAITLNEESKTLKIGETLTLSANIMPETATNTHITWSSDNQSVASVVDGTVTALAEGRAVIKALGESGISAICTIMVEKAAEDSVNNAQNEKSAIIKALIGLVGDLPEASVITLSDKDKIVEVRNKLDQAKAKGIIDGDITNLKKLVDCEAAIAAIEKGLVDKTSQIKGAIDAIAALPEANALTLADKSKVSAARDMVSRAKISGALESDITNIKKLLDCESGIAALEKASADKSAAVKAAIDMITALPEVNLLVIGDKDKVSNARKSVNDAKAKGALDGDISNLKKLADCEAKIAALQTPVASGSTSGSGSSQPSTPPIDYKGNAIAAAKSAIDALPATITLSDKAKVEAARKKVDDAIKIYGATNADITNLSKLVNAEKVIAQLDNSEKAKQAAIKAAIDAIAALPATINLSDKAKVEEARQKADAAINNYGAISSDITNLTKLVEAEKAIAQLDNSYKAKQAAIKSAIDAINLLPAVITLNDKAKIETARQKVDDAIKLYGATNADIINITKLVDAEKVIAQLDNAEKAKQAAIKAAVEAIAALPDAIALSDKGKVEAARQKVNDAINTYGAIKDNITNLAKLCEAEKAIERLEHAMNVAVIADGNVVRITVTNSALKNDIISITITERGTGLIRYVDQKTLSSGSITIETKLNNGTYDIALRSLSTNEIVTIPVLVNAMVEVTGITISQTPSSCNVGETLKLTAVVTPDNASNKNISWEAVDTSIATVDNTGLVRGVKAGTTTINAYSFDKKIKASCNIEIIDQAALSKASAIKAAVEAIASLPSYDNLKLEDESKVINARGLVNEAKQKGAAENEISNIDVLVKLEGKIIDLKNAGEKAQIINTVVTAINGLPDVSVIKLTDKTMVTQVRGLVTEAEKKGIGDSEISNISKLTGLESKISDIEVAVKTATDVISNLPNPDIDVIKLENKPDVEVARGLVNAAKDKGAVDGDFSNLDKLIKLEAKIKELEQPK